MKNFRKNWLGLVSFWSLGAIFMVLKLLGVTGWSWWLVLSPILLWVLLVLATPLIIVLLVKHNKI